MDLCPAEPAAGTHSVINVKRDSANHPGSLSRAYDNRGNSY